MKHKIKIRIVQFIRWHCTRIQKNYIGTSNIIFFISRFTVKIKISLHILESDASTIMMFNTKKKNLV